MSEENLKPCAHCGGVAKIPKSVSCVECTECHMSTPIVFPVEGAVRIWNTRQSDVEGAIAIIDVKVDELNDIFNKQGEWQVSIDVVHEWLWSIKNKLQGVE